MEPDDSDDDNMYFAMVDLISNWYQNQRVRRPLSANQELLRRKHAELGPLLCTKKVDEALAVAKEMTSIAPTSWAAALYERLITRFKELLDSMDKAAASMATLYDSRTKVDFISRLPFDIVIHIVDYLWGIVSNMEDDTTPTFLYVSKHWRQTILESTPFLSYQLSATKLLDFDKATLSPASRIRTMTIGGRVISFSQLLGNHLCNLSHLCIDVPFNAATCTNGVPFANNDMCLDVRHKYNLDEVMERCPNLVSLTWSHCVLGVANATKYRQLRVLAVGLIHGVEGLLALVKKLPCLVVLSSFDVLHIAFLNRVMKCCPSLKCLKYNTSINGVIKWPYEWDTTLESGIQELSFHGGYYEDIPEYAVDNLVRASKTLKYLHFGEDSFYYQSVMPLLPDISFPRLIRLSGSPGYGDIRLIMSTIIPRAPCIETIKFGDPFIMWKSRAPVDLMATCAKLVDVNVIMGEFQQDLDALKRFLGPHVQRGSSSTLQSLSIGLWSKKCARELLPLITKLPLLEDLHRVVSFDSPMAMILDSISGNNVMNVKQLKITVLGCCVEEPTLARLQHAHTLTSLIIDGGYLPTLAALSLLALTQLKHFQIPFEGLDDHIIDILRKQFPNMIAL